MKTRLALIAATMLATTACQNAEALDPDPAADEAILCAQTCLRTLAFADRIDVTARGIDAAKAALAFAREQIRTFPDFERRVDQLEPEANRLLDKNVLVSETDTCIAYLRNHPDFEEFATRWERSKR